MTIRWRRRALEDVGEYSAVIREASLRAADNWEDAVKAKLRDAARFPRMGRIVPEFDQDDLRELITYSHRLIYRIREGQIEVLRVWHGTRMLHRSDLGAEE